MVSLVVLVASVAAAGGAGEPTAATVFVTRGAVASSVVEGVRSQLAEAYLATGLKTKDVGVVQGAGADKMLGCFADSACLERLETKVGATHLVLVLLSERGDLYSAEVIAWTSGLEARRAQIGASNANEIAFDVARTAGWALGRLESKLRADAKIEAAKTGPPPADKTEKADSTETTETAEESPEFVPAHETIAGELPRQQDGRVTLDQLMRDTDETETEQPSTWAYREDAPSQSFAAQFVAAGVVLPVQHNRTYLAIGDALAKNQLGVPAVALGVALRLPWRAVPDLYQTDFISYGINGTLLLLTFDVGLEKRWPLLSGALSPLVGASMNLALQGLPVPDGGGEQLATAWALGVFGYAGLVFNLHRRVGIHLHAGYRHSLRRASQFGAGGDVYYARDAHGDTWNLALSGLMARLGVSFEF